MPAEFSHPGVFIEEMPSSRRSIVGVSTSATAFVDVFKRGPVDEPTRMTSMADFERTFGGVWESSEASYGISQFFLNGGATAWVVRVAPDSAAEENSSGKAATSPLDPGRVSKTANELKGAEFKSFESGTDGFADPVSEQSNTAENFSNRRTAADAVAALLVPTDGEANRTGIYALNKIVGDNFALLCLPSTALMQDSNRQTVQTAASKLCGEHRAMYVVDPPIHGPGSTGQLTVEAMRQLALDELTELAETAAVYYPSVTITDARRAHRQIVVGPSGTIAGIMARTDTERGVWKAPAGTEAVLRGASPVLKLSDADNGPLNAMGVNVLRTFPRLGDVCWGSRTTDGADMKASQWKYVPVRRTALFIESSLFASTKWVVFEPNDEPLWAQIRLNVDTFMHNLFRQGAFAGSKPRDGYLVKCDSETTTQSDMDNGIVNIVVGFALLKPAEFVVIHISQKAKS